MIGMGFVNDLRTKPIPIMEWMRAFTESRS